MNSALSVSYEIFCINYCFTQCISFSLSSCSLLALSITLSSFSYVFLGIIPFHFERKHIVHIVHTLTNIYLHIYIMNETIMGLILRIYVVVVIFYKIYFCHIICSVSFPSIDVRNVYSNDVMSKYYDRTYNSWDITRC